MLELMWFLSICCRCHFKVRSKSKGWVYTRKHVSAYIHGYSNNDTNVPQEV